MSEKDVKALAYHSLEECNKGKIPAMALMAKIYAPDLITPGNSEIEKTLALGEVKKTMSTLMRFWTFISYLFTDHR